MFQLIIRIIFCSGIYNCLFFVPPAGATPPATPYIIRHVSVLDACRTGWLLILYCIVASPLPLVPVPHSSMVQPLTVSPVFFTVMV